MKHQTEDKKDEGKTDEDELNTLAKQRKSIEDQLNDLANVLARNNIGMHEDLVDSEGFPRSDINVYEVRLARAAIINLKNDFKAINEKIEKIVQQKIPYDLDSGRRESTPSIKNPKIWGKELAVFSNIRPGSPVFQAGLANGDIIVQFGSIDATNFKTLDDIIAVVSSNENLYIKVVVKRDGEFKRVNLKPRKWEGPGLLGCKIDSFVLSK